MRSPLRTLGLWEPWASAVAAGYKGIETRGWSTKHRGWLVIIATKTINAQIRAGKERFKHLGLTYHHGHAVALVRVVSVCSTNWPGFNPTSLGPLELSLGNYEEGRFAWTLRDRIPLTPFPALAAQRFGIPTEETKREVLRQLRNRRLSA